jgi:hypothetical protein
MQPGKDIQACNPARGCGEQYPGCGQLHSMDPVARLHKRVLPQLFLFSPSNAGLATIPVCREQIFSLFVEI